MEQTLSGEIPRRSFERGFKTHFKRAADGHWEADPWIMDERFMATHVKGKGIAIFTGCSHAGVVNICRHAREVFHDVPLYALVGGLHLVYPNDDIISETIAELRKFGLRVIIPGHCTGWRAVHALISTFGEEIVDPLAVGSRQTLWRSSRRPTLAAADRALPMDQCRRGFMRIAAMLGHWFVTSMCWAATPAFTQEHHKDHSAADLNRQFQDPNLDVQKFVQRFETDSREIFAQRQAIVQAVDLRPGLAVADIGAGTGLFTWMFAEKVGPKGTVYAVEIAPAFLKSIGEQARQRGLEKVVKTVRSTQEATNLAPGSTDVAFVCATYHHFEHPEKVLASIHQALRPGGRLVVIDFDLRKDSSAFVRERARASKEVYFREIEAAGFTRVKAKPPLNLKENFFAVFQRRRGASLPGRRST